MKRVFFSVACLLAALVLMAPDTALAKGKKKDQGGDKKEAQFRSLDTDKDGKLSKAEFALIESVPKDKKGNDQTPAIVFSMLDENRDGVLTLDEFKKLGDGKKKKKKV